MGVSVQIYIVPVKIIQQFCTLARLEFCNKTYFMKYN